jgi:hypothetical protein
VLWLLRGGLHATRRIRRSFDFSSAWTTAVIAGMLGLGLTFLLFALAPPPEAAVNASMAATQPHAPTEPASSASPSPVIPSDVRLEFQRTYLPFGWDQNESALVESMTPPPLPQSRAFVMVPRDDWQAAAIRPAVAATSAAQPYYLRAPRVDAAAAAAALDAVDVPPGESGPTFERNLAIAIERVAAAGGTDDDAAGEYSLIVRNTSGETVDSVTIRDTVPEIEHVIDVVPPAAVAPDGTLVWNLDNLGPGQEVRLTVTVQATGEPIVSTSAVDVASRVGVRTHVAQLDRPPPFAPATDAPDLVLPDPAVLTGNIIGSGPAPFDDELPESASGMPLPADVPGNPADADLIVPDSILPATAIPSGPVNAFDDELPAGVVELNPFDPAAAAADRAADMPAAAIPFDDVIPDPSSGSPADTAPALSESTPFDPFAATPAEADAPNTPSSDHNEPMDDAVLPLERPTPAPATPAVEPDRTQEPAWAPRTLATDEWESPPRPILNVKARSPHAVHRGEIVTAYYDITNTGNAPAVDVVLTVHLPVELLHKHGNVVEHRIERLEPGESRRARLLARARSNGTARLDATLSHADQNDAEAAVSIRVVGGNTGPRRAD